MSSRREEKEAARARREASEREAAARAARKQRLTILGGVLAAAVVIVVVIIAVSSGGGSKKKAAPASGPVRGTAQVATLLKGIPQHGTLLGDPKAPVTLVEYADLKCPICQQYSLLTAPTLIRRYVRTGKLRIQFRAQTFVGEPKGNSAVGARFALAAAEQDKFWNFSELFYINQQNENTAYVDDAFLRRIGNAVPGLDVAKAFAARGAASIGRTLKADGRAFDAAGFTGTPSFELGRSGSQLSPYKVTSFDPKVFGAAIDKLLKA